MEAYTALLTPHDFFHFASKDYAVGVTEKAIHNTALMYSLNRHIPTVQRVIDGNEPHYKEDFSLFQLYSTPAQLSPDMAVFGSEVNRWSSSEGTVKITYNSVDSPLVFSMEGPSFLRKTRPGLKEAFPKMGSYLNFPPLSTFTFFVLGGQGPRLIRIGKKMPPARVAYTPIEGIVERTGRFKASHPVSLLDLPPFTKLRSGYIIRMPPSPLTMDAELEGIYLEGRVDGIKVFIAKPNIEHFPGVFS